MNKNLKRTSVMVFALSLFGYSSNALASERTSVSTSNVIQQEGKLTGTITDELGPLTGASIICKGTTNGTIADLDGNFVLSNIKNGDILVVSFIGYKEQEIAYNGQTTLNIVMHEDAQQLSEVVVTALGIKREKKALGYSVSSVNGEDITNAGTPMNAMSALYGKTAGLQLQSTASGPSGGINIKVRNAMSLNESSSTRPLIVLDGVPIHDENTGQTSNSRSGGDKGTGLNDINPEDIASIEILKGAKAAVLYGSEGANGVMLITTKSGKNKGLGIDFSTNYTWNNAAYYPELQNEFGSGSSAGSAALSQISKDGFYMSEDANGNMVESLWKGGSANFGPRMDGRDLLWWDGTMRPYSAQQDNQTDLYRTGHQSNVNLAISNSGDFGSFRLSYNWKDYESISVGADNEAHSFNFAANLVANKYVKLKVNTNYTHTTDNNAPYTIGDMSTYGIPREQDVNLIRDLLVTDDGYNRYASDKSLTTFAPYTGYIGSYYWSQLQNSNQYTRSHLIQSVNLDVTLNDNFSWNTLGGMDWTVSDQETKQHVTRPLVDENKQGYYGLENKRNNIFYAQTAFNYDQTFNEKWNVNAMIGGAIKRKTMEKQNQYIKETFAIENWFSLNNTREDFGARSDRARGSEMLLSVYASAQLAYDNQLYLEVQARNDWSSILPPSNNQYFYPGASLSWIFTEAIKVPKMNFGKIRASWADVGRPGPLYYGNVDFSLGSYGGIPTMGMGDYLPPADFTSANGSFPAPNLKPERKREYEFGLEASFFNQNRVSVDFSYFTSNTYNQIVTLPVPTSSGVKQVRLNAGDIAQNGVEFALNTKPIILKDFSWELGVNFANYSTKIVELAKGVTEQQLWGGTGASVMAPVGGEFGEIWVRPYKVNEQGERIVNQGTGVYEFDNTEFKKVGKITPDVVGGLTTALNYKDFSLNAVFDFQFGATMISQTNMYLLGNGSSKESLQFRDEARGGLPYYLNNDGQRILLDSHAAAVPNDSYYPFILHDGVITPGVTPDGEKNEKVISAETYYSELYWQGGSQMSEDQMYKSDYISLRSLSLSYNLPKSFTKKLKIQNARVNVYGNNLCYVYKAIPNVTPESTQGTNSYTEMASLPGIRSFGVGLNVSF